MYKHSKRYEIRYTDVDFEDKLKISALLSLMEESACLSADELGFGYSVLQPKNLGFILANWYVELFRPIGLEESLTVDTWPIKPNKLVVFRDFELYAGDEKVGVATSRWCVVDLEKFVTVPAAAAFSREFEYNIERSVEIKNWKVARPVNGETRYVKQVGFSDYDHYNHANNTRYADFVFDAFSVDELRGKSVKTFKISYIRQCKCGEQIVFTREKTDGGLWLVEGAVNGEPSVRAEISFYD